MADGEMCPRCGQALVVHGSFQSRGGVGFRPKELRLFTLSLQFPEVSVRTAPAACVGCGHVWAEVDPAALRQKLHDLGNEAVRERLGLLDEK